MRGLAMVLTSVVVSFQVQAVAPMTAQEFAKLTKESLKPRSSFDISAMAPDTHSQGLVRLGDRFIVSGVNGTRGKATKGYIRAFYIDANGRMVYNQGSAADNQEIDLGQGEFHVGGMDYNPETKRIVTVVAQYNPNTTTTLISVDPADLSQYEKLGKFADHLGALFMDLRADRRKMFLFNWDSEKSYTVDMNGIETNKGGNLKATPQTFKSRVKSESSFQDCKSFSDGYALCSGTKFEKGYVDSGTGTISLVREDQATGQMVVDHRIKVDVVGGETLTRNAFTFETVEENGKRSVDFHFINLDDANAKLITYRADLN